jgi:hypothetical protein
VPDFLQYICEWLEMSSHGEKSRKARTTKGYINMNTLKNRMVNKLALVALLFALALPLVPKVYASGPFATSYSDASLTGVYGYSLDGWVLGPSSPNSNTTNVPLDVAGGVMWFDGVGTVEFHDTPNLGGSVTHRGTADNPVFGTYTVNPDGTGTMQWFGGGGGVHIRAFTIVDGGKEIQFGEADSLGTHRGVAKKQ